MLRIIAGLYKGRLLKTPKGKNTRPTQSMLREALFNICQLTISQARFLDLYAGSGAMGLEALSRGASHATFIENHPQAIRCIRENIAELHVENQTTLLTFPLQRSLQLLTPSFDILYLDPPYDTPIAPILKQLPPLLAPQALLFVEERYRPKAPPLDAPSSLLLIDSRHFGEALLHQYQFSDTKEP